MHIYIYIYIYVYYNDLKTMNLKKGVGMDRRNKKKEDKIKIMHLLAVANQCYMLVILEYYNGVMCMVLILHTMHVWHK